MRHTSEVLKKVTNAYFVETILAKYGPESLWQSGRRSLRCLFGDSYIMLEDPDGSIITGPKYFKHD